MRQSLSLALAVALALTPSITQFPRPLVALHLHPVVVYPSLDNNASIYKYIPTEKNVATFVDTNWDNPPSNYLLSHHLAPPLLMAPSWILLDFFLD